MNDDLIKRSDAIKAIEELPNAYNGWSDAYDKAYIIGTLEEVPKADRPQKVIAQITFDEEKLREIVKEAVERFKEEYEITDRPQGHYIKGESGEWYCSECKRIDDKYSVAKFCWYCGAKMDGEREGE